MTLYLYVSAMYSSVLCEVNHAVRPKRSPRAPFHKRRAKTWPLHRPSLRTCPARPPLELRVCVGVLLSGGMAPRPKDMVRLAQLKVQSYHKKFITDGCADISSSAVQMGLQIGGIVPLPTKKRLITILKGPFVDKKALQQHHHATHKRLIELYGKSTTGQCATSCVHFLRYLEHTIMQLHPGISVRVTLFSDEVAEAQGGARSAVVRAAIGADALPPPQS